MDHALAGDNNGRWAGSYEYPLDHHVYEDNVKDMILMVRQHPSLLFWCGGNELYPKHKLSEMVLMDLPSLLHQYDPGRFYITSSMSNYTQYDPDFALAPKDGPYGILLPSEFYVRNPGLTFWNGTRADQLPLSFQPEIGSVSSPSFESLQRFMSTKNLNQFPGYESPNKMGKAWSFHNYIGFITSNTTWRPQLKIPFNHIHALLNGRPANVSEYALASQIVQMQQYHCLFEGFQQFMFQYYTAVIMWKSQSPWPVLRGALYDSYLSQTGGYWGVRRALASQIHVQLNFRTFEPTVLNKGSVDYSTAKGTVLLVRVFFYALDGTLVRVEERPLSSNTVASNAVVVLNQVQWPVHVLKGDETLLVRLELSSTLQKDDATRVLASNFYWSSDPTQPIQQYTDLAVLHQNVQEWVDVSATLSTPIFSNETDLNTYTVALSLSKKASNVAMFVQMDLIDQSTGDRILPVWFSDNLICLVPGEARTLTVTTSVAIEEPRQVALRVSGWNVNRELWAMSS
jgi:mannosylglycoprotein endo-beta-mannosidase